MWLFVFLPGKLHLEDAWSLEYLGTCLNLYEPDLTGRLLNLSWCVDSMGLSGQRLLLYYILFFTVDYSVLVTIQQQFIPDS